ncbi:hypothetical protein Pisl_1479 [Pyrobaculum islandicum DSM 4184]|uniref:PIN domain-containing protein n=1 Tax=Pyrobaculum islandicum (strain DSM 4184 / JCM 9189 / GEO3) TaxID=384616 RepID=A1RUK3_PYRIL|nr:PIN domain-containing protein [Pyrobaculum islandicum]ABL88635.1 hypothetical protein Pisl_1479 [Pyrobaculum islandicum DSM 4184]
MTYYIDTNVLISYLFVSEHNHIISQKILENIANQRHTLYGSTITFVEMYNTICRKIRGGRWKFIDPIQKYLEKITNSENRCKLVIAIIYELLKERLGIKFVDCKDLYEFEKFEIGKHALYVPQIFKVLLEELTPKLTIRFKDLIHLAYVYMLSKICNIDIKYFLTFDVEDFGKIKNHIKQALGIEIVSPLSPP